MDKTARTITTAAKTISTKGAKTHTAGPTIRVKIGITARTASRLAPGTATNGTARARSIAGPSSTAATASPSARKWYKDHPKAWKYDGNNNNANIYIGGTLPGLYGWLGWGNVPQQYRSYYGNNVSQFNRAHYGEWYPLGVFSLMAGPGDNGTRIVQLAVDQHGHISGNYYDMITGSNYSVSGDIRQQSQRASFALNKNQMVRFRAPVYQLLQPYGPITVSLPGGDQQWQFVRLEN